MAQDPELEELKTRVRIEGLGPLQDFLDPIVETGASLLAHLRQSASDHPLMAIYMALQAGYFVAKLTRRHAQR